MASAAARKRARTGGGEEDAEPVPHGWLQAFIFGARVIGHSPRAPCAGTRSPSDHSRAWNRLPAMSKRAAKARLVPASMAAPTATLVARLSRQDLERLLVRSVESGAVHRDDVLSLLPEAKQQAELPRLKHVGVSAARSGTGYFDDIDDDLLVKMILAKMPSDSRFVCAISTCKAWRSLRDAPELWSDIVVSSTGSLSRRGWGVMNGTHLLKLVAWLRNPGGVHSLSVEAADRSGIRTLKRTRTAPLYSTVVRCSIVFVARVFCAVL